MRPGKVVLEDQVLSNGPGMIHNDVFARDTVVCIFGGEAVAIVVIVVNVVCKISDVSKDALMGPN